MDREQALPPNWFKIWHNDCDLDVAFDLLQGWNHFHSDTMRGRVRSLQLRPREAWAYFDRAARRIDEFQDSLQNKIRAFYLHVYSFENLLVESSSDEGRLEDSTRYCDSVVTYPLTQEEFELADQLKLFMRILDLLNHALYGEARSSSGRLLQMSSRRMGDEKVGFYFAASIACKGAGEEAESARHLENALMGIPALANKFNIGLYTGTAMALLRFWGMESRSLEWEQFLQALQIPPRTTEILRERSWRMFERSASLNRVFVF